MFLNKTVLGIIPARGGSKGVPGKNLRDVAGKPLLAWTAEAAINSGVFDRLILSTDSKEIADCGKSCRVDVPFLRPGVLASDTATAIQVVNHAMNWVEKHDKVYDLVFYLQPTSPLRTSQDIIVSLALCSEKQADAIVSVCEAEHPPHLMNVLPANGCLQGFISENTANNNRQEHETYYRVHGAIRSSGWDYFVKTQSWFSEKTFAYVMPVERSLDIDTELDIRVADFLLREKRDTGDPPSRA